MWQTSWRRGVALLCGDSWKIVRYSHCWLTPQNYRWQNGKQYIGKTNRGQSALVLGAPGLYRPAPPSLHSYIGLLQNSIDKILWNTKFQQNYLEFREIGGKFCETQNKNFCENFVKLRKQIFLQLPYSYTIFIAARQCYLEINTIKQLYFSILSFIIWWLTLCWHYPAVALIAIS